MPYVKFWKNSLTCSFSLLFLIIMIVETDLIDVIVRTKNSEEFLRECLQSVIDEIPVRRIIVVDNGLTTRQSKSHPYLEKLTYTSNLP